MRIAYTIQSLSNSGGIERVVVNKANWLAMHDHEVSIITTNDSDSFYKLSDKVRVYSLDLNNEINKRNKFLSPFQKLISKRKHVHRLQNLLRELKPEIVSSIHSDDFYYLPFINKTSKKIFEYHYVSIEENNIGKTGFLNRLKGKTFSWLHNLTFKKYDAIVFLSKKETEIYSNFRNVHNIPNTKTFNVKERANLNACNVIAIGNLIPLKGFDVLLKTWKEIHVLHPQWKLNIFGDGPEHENLESMIKDFSLENSVSLKGRSNNIQKELLNSSILVSTSKSESFSMVLLEAQSVGIPCVAFDCPFGPSEIVMDGHTGFLIPLNDLDSFKEKLSLLMTNLELRRQQGENAIRNSERFDQDKIMNSWLDLFQIVFTN